MTEECVFLFKGRFVLLIGIGPYSASVRRLDGTDPHWVYHPDGSASMDSHVDRIRPLSPTPTEPADYGLVRPASIPLERRVDLAALRHHDDVEAAWRETRYSRLPPIEPLPLTPEQVTFLVKHHGDIVRSYFEPDLFDSLSNEWESEPGSPRIVGDILSRRTYRRIFGKMSWDDAYDRYEDTPEFDRFFQCLLHYALVLAQDILGWALAQYLRRYDEDMLQALLEFQDAYPDVFNEMIANAHRLKSSLKGARNYGPLLDAFYRDAAEKVRLFRAETKPQE